MSVITVRAKILETLSAVSGIPTIKVEGENFKPTKTGDYPFVRFMVQPRESTPRDLNSGKQIGAGLIWIQLFYSRSNNNADAAYLMADSILDAFPLSTTILDDSQLMIEASWSEKITEEASAIMLPIFIRYRNFSF